MDNKSSNSGPMPPLENCSDVELVSKSEDFTNGKQQLSTDLVGEKDCGTNISPHDESNI